jgi:hypothetical protein
MGRFAAVVLGILGVLLPVQVHAQEGQERAVYFVQPADGAEVGPNVHVIMGVRGMKVRPAGEFVKGTGHHHLIIDGSPLPQGKVVPKDDHHMHFGKGQTEADIRLSPGRHTLTLQFADGLHRSYGPALSSTVHITVK